MNGLISLTRTAAWSGDAVGDGDSGGVPLGAGGYVLVQAAASSAAAMRKGPALWDWIIGPSAYGRAGRSPASLDLVVRPEPT